MSNRYKNAPVEMCEIIDGIDIREPVTETVYRVTKSGRKDEEAFDNTYTEMLKGTTRNNWNLNELGTYSTSVYLVPGPCEKMIKMLAKRHRDKYPSPGILTGNILLTDGRAQRTQERIADYDDPDHVDWWIFCGNEAAIADRFEFM